MRIAYYLFAYRGAVIRILQVCNSHIAGLLFLMFFSAIRMCFSLASECD